MSDLPELRLLGDRNLGCSGSARGLGCQGYPATRDPLGCWSQIAFCGCSKYEPGVKEAQARSELPARLPAAASAGTAELLRLEPAPAPLSSRERFPGGTACSGLCVGLPWRARSPRHAAGHLPCFPSAPSRRPGTD